MQTWRARPPHERTTARTTPGLDTVAVAADDPDARAAVGRARPQARRVRSGSARSSAAARPAPSWRCTRSCGASTAPTSRSKVHLKQFGEIPPGDAGRQDARRHRRERRRRRHRPGLRRHLQGRVAQPPVVRRALPGRRDRRRRHRPRHPRDGRPAGRGDGPAALRPARRPRHPPGAARDRGRRRRLRQLPRPAQHRRRGRLRRDLPRQPAGQRAVRRRAAPRGPPPRQGVRRRQPGRSCTAPAPAATASAASPCSRRETFDDGGPAKRPERPGRRPVHGEAAHRVHASSSSPPASSPASRTSAAPGSPAPPPSSPAPATAACTSSSTGCRCATPRSRPRRSS